MHGLVIARGLKQIIHRRSSHMFKLLKRFVVIIASIYASSVWADSAPTCYQFSVPDSPEADAAIVDHKETWCYQTLNYPVGSIFVFNADSAKVLPELSFTIDADGVMTHTSLMQGQRTVHKVLVKEYNPFSVPYNEPKNMQPVYSEILDHEMQSSANEALRILSSPSATVETFEMDTGIISEDADIKPWRGYWWAYNGRPLSNGKNSPMAKYDRFVKARTGSSPGAQAWENSRHRYHGINWEGHCNGWAASSVLRPEPKTSKYDEQSGVTFTVVDQKGLLAETDYCAKVAFFGSRYRGSNSNARDISSVLFHKTLRYYIGTLKKPIATDYKQLEEVDNHVISGYTMKIKKTGTRTYSVVTKIRIHKYDKARTNTPGDAPMYTRTYSYRLRVDDEDNIVGGSWTSSNPDFLWVPLASIDCKNNNPRINHDYVQEILDLKAIR